MSPNSGQHVFVDRDQAVAKTRCQAKQELAANDAELKKLKDQFSA